MKKLVFVNETIAFTTEVCTEYYYGVIRGDEKAFITRTSYNGGDFVVRSKDKLTKGNGYPCFTRTNLRNLIEAIILDGDTVYQFETADELFRWLVTPVNPIDNNSELV